MRNYRFNYFGDGGNDGSIGGAGGVVITAN